MSPIDILNVAWPILLALIVGYVVRLAIEHRSWESARGKARIQMTKINTLRSMDLPITEKNLARVSDKGFIFIDALDDDEPERFKNPDPAHEAAPVDGTMGPRTTIASMRLHLNRLDAQLRTHGTLNAATVRILIHLVTHLTVLTKTGTYGTPEPEAKSATLPPIDDNALAYATAEDLDSIDEPYLSGLSMNELWERFGLLTRIYDQSKQGGPQENLERARAAERAQKRITAVMRSRDTKSAPQPPKESGLLKPITLEVAEHFTAENFDQITTEVLEHYTKEELRITYSALTHLHDQWENIAQVPGGETMLKALARAMRRVSALIWARSINRPTRQESTPTPLEAITALTERVEDLERAAREAEGVDRLRAAYAKRARRAEEHGEENPPSAHGENSPFAHNSPTEAQEGLQSTETREPGADTGRGKMDAEGPTETDPTPTRRVWDINEPPRSSIIDAAAEAAEPRVWDIRAREDSAYARVEPVYAAEPAFSMLSRAVGYQAKCEHETHKPYASAVARFDRHGNEEALKMARRWARMHMAAKHPSIERLRASEASGPEDGQSPAGEAEIASEGRTARLAGISTIVLNGQHGYGGQAIAATLRNPNGAIAGVRLEGIDANSFYSDLGPISSAMTPVLGITLTDHRFFERPLLGMTYSLGEVVLTFDPIEAEA